MDNPDPNRPLLSPEDLEARIILDRTQLEHDKLIIRRDGFIVENNHVLRTSESKTPDIPNPSSKFLKLSNEFEELASGARSLTFDTWELQKEGKVIANRSERQRILTQQFRMNLENELVLRREESRVHSQMMFEILEEDIKRLQLEYDKLLKG